MLNVALVPVKLGATVSVAPVADVGVIAVMATFHEPAAVPVPLIVRIWAKAAYATDARPTTTSAAINYLLRIYYLLYNL